MDEDGIVEEIEHFSVLVMRLWYSDLCALVIICSGRHLWVSRN
jgi:hypothetical protein